MIKFIVCSTDTKRPYINVKARHGKNLKDGTRMACMRIGMRASHDEKQSVVRCDGSSDKRRERTYITANHTNATPPTLSSHAVHSCFPLSAATVCCCCCCIACVSFSVGFAGAVKQSLQPFDGFAFILVLAKSTQIYCSNSKWKIIYQDYIYIYTHT